MLKRQKKDISESYQNKINNLEKEIVRKDDKIKRLEDSKKDMKERINELREDIRYISKRYRNEEIIIQK